MQNGSLCPWTFSACHVSFLGILYKVKRDKDRQPYATRTAPTSGLGMVLVQGSHRHTGVVLMVSRRGGGLFGWGHPLYHCQAPCDALRATEVVWGCPFSSTTFSWGVLSKYCWLRDSASHPGGDERWLGEKRHT